MPWDSPPWGEWLSKIPQLFWLFEATLERGGSIALEPGHPPIRVTQMGWSIIPLVLEHLP
jgi:hypothetical protein